MIGDGEMGKCASMRRGVAEVLHAEIPEKSQSLFLN